MRLREVGHLRTLRLPSILCQCRVPEIDKVLKASEEFLDGPLLVSAYDVYHNKITPPFDFASSAVFLDSGGYEVSRQLDLSEVEDQTDSSRLYWSKDFYDEVL